MKVALISSEPLRPRMAGIGIRYLEFARRLPEAGLEIALFGGSGSASASELDLSCRVEALERGRLGEQLAGFDAAVAQGQLANDLVIEVPSLPCAIDLYDPWLVENLSYYPSRGLDPYRNDHATWVLQLSRGDFFLCSSEEQRLYYLGLLTALGRVNPLRYREDPGLRSLIAAVPFGVPEELPEHRPVLEPATEGSLRVLFGGLYDWYDPLTVLEALAAEDRLAWELLFVRTANPESTPQGATAEVQRWLRRQADAVAARVGFLDWQPFERRFDLLRDVDVLLSTHRGGLETDLSLRTRFLEAMAAGTAVVCSAGGGISRLIFERGAGWVVPIGDRDALRQALREIAGGGPGVASRLEAGRALAAEFSWPRVLEPLVRFCADPVVDATKAEFAHELPTRCPSPTAGQRLRRRLRGLTGRP